MMTMSWPASTRNQSSNHQQTRKPKASFPIGVAGCEPQTSQLNRPTDSNFLLKVCIFCPRLGEGGMKNIYYAARTNNRCWSLLVGTVVWVGNICLHLPKAVGLMLRLNLTGHYQSF
jgi:hypothetical protein